MATEPDDFDYTWYDDAPCESVEIICVCGKPSGGNGLCPECRAELDSAIANHRPFPAPRYPRSDNKLVLAEQQLAEQVWDEAYDEDYDHTYCTCANWTKPAAGTDLCPVCGKHTLPS